MHSLGFSYQFTGFLMKVLQHPFCFPLVLLSADFVVYSVRIYGNSFFCNWQGWEETIIKQEQSAEGQSDMKIALPSMPSLYIISFLFRACEEIHRIGGHILEKIIIRKFATTLLEKVLV